MYRATKDNCKASIGKIIKAVSDPLLASNPQQLKELYTYWVSFLPLKHDDEEALGQHEMLITLLKNKPELLIDENNLQSLQTIMMAFAWLWNNKAFCNEQTNNGIREMLVAWSNDEKMTALIGKLDIADGTKAKFMDIIQSNGN